MPRLGSISEPSLPVSDFHVGQLAPAGRIRDDLLLRVPRFAGAVREKSLRVVVSVQKCLSIKIAK